MLRIKQAGTCGGAASIRIDDPTNPDIEFVESCLTGPDPGAGKVQIAVQSDKFQIKGRNSSSTVIETIVVFLGQAQGTILASGNPE